MENVCIGKDLSNDEYRRRFNTHRWIFKPEFLMLSTGSRIQGISHSVEMKHRFYCCSRITDMGKMLNLYPLNSYFTLCYYNIIYSVTEHIIT